MSTRAEAAREYAEQGIPIFPLHHIREDGTCSCGKPDCQSPGKHPRTTQGFKDATAALRTVEQWWSEWPEANIGMPTGSPSGFVVIDVDPRNGGDQTLEAIRGDLPDTAVSLTGGGGQHFIYKQNGTSYRCRSNWKPGIDVKAEGGYIVLPPSNHASGGSYAWDGLFGFAASDIAEVPKGLGLPQAGETPVVQQSVRTLERIGNGSRNNTLASVAGTMRRRGLDQDAITAALLIENQKKCDPPLPESEVRNIAASIGRYPPAHEITGIRSLTEAGNAALFVDLHGERVRYVPAWKQWMTYEAGRWIKDEGEARIAGMYEDVIRALHHEAAQVDGKDERKSIGGHAKASESARAMKACLELVRRKEAICTRADAFDADPWLLNCPDGTIELRTGELRPHAPADLLTKMTAARYGDTRPKPGLWLSCLQRWIGDWDTIAFIARAMGSSLIGDNLEERIFLDIGPGNSGKTTFNEAVAATVGDYAGHANFSTFTEDRSKGSNASEDLARLHGRRIVFTSEVPPNARLAEQMIKSVTGRDTITARFLYGRSFDFKPQFTIWAACNDAPRVKADDDAMWRRIVRVPFERAIPEAERDPSVKTRLTDPDECGTEILRWLVGGLLDYLDAGGLETPQRVLEVTRAYRDDEDPLADFLADRCEIGAGKWAATKDLMDAYREWCEANGETQRIKSTRSLGKLLQRHGCVTNKVRDKRGQAGIALRGGAAC